MKKFKTNTIKAITTAAVIICATGMFGSNVHAEWETDDTYTVYDGVYIDSEGGIYYYQNGQPDYSFTGMAAWYDMNDLDNYTCKYYWFDSGIVARDKQVYSPLNDAWYWFDEDGTMACSKDVYIPESNDNRAVGKWVRYREHGSMVKGLDKRYGGYYYFDKITGEMKKGFAYIEDWDTWAYFDDITGQARTGESYIDGNWYRFDSYGRMQYGFFTDDSGNRYYYDSVTGIMIKGEFCVDDNWYYADEITGILAIGEVYHHGAWYYYGVDNAMQKGVVMHDGHEYYYDPMTGVMQYGKIYHDNEDHYYDNVTGVRIPAPISQEDEDRMNYEYARKCLELQNAIRVEHGVAELEWDEELYNQIKIRGIEISESFSHTRPNGQRCFTVVFTSNGYMGENIAAGHVSPEAVSTGWYNSEGHRRNMLNSNFKKAAVVCYNKSGRLYWVTMFTD